MKNNLLYFVKLLIFPIICLTFLFSQTQLHYKPGYQSGLHLNSEKYITGDDGVVRMNINIWGHVKYPGTYLMYDNIDIFTALSLAGGPMKGANLSKILIVSSDGSSKEINLNKLMKNSRDIMLELSPNDTIYIDEKIGHLLLSKSSIISVLLQITNLILINNDWFSK